MPPRPSVEVRPATAEDRRNVEACVDAAYAPFVDAIGKRPAPMLADYERLIESDQVWVAEIDDLLVGLIGMWSEADHWYVDNIAVDLRHQGVGIGAVLLDVAEQSARRAHVGEIRLYTNEVMTANTEYYPRRGFIETHRLVDDAYRRIFYSRPVPFG